MKLEQLPNQLYKQFANVGQALSNATRLRILNLLCQTERSVDDLADKLDQSVANTSAHLKVLKQARLVEGRKEGRRVFYGLAGEPALRLWLALRDMGMQALPEVREAMRTYASEDALLPDLVGEELLDKVRRGEVVLVDLRPDEEYEAGRVPHARSIPSAELEARLNELPKDREVVAYCRGPYCVAAIESVRRLRDAGFDARRMREGIAEWKAAGLPIETNTQSEHEIET